MYFGDQNASNNFFPSLPSQQHNKRSGNQQQPLYKLGTMVASSSHILWVLLLSAILTLIPVSSTEEVVALRDYSSNNNLLRRRTRRTTIDAVAVIDEKEEHAARNADRDSGVVAVDGDIPIASLDRMLTADSFISDSREQSHLNNQDFERADATTVTTTITPSVHRRTQDIEDILNDMSTKDPSEWSAVEWIVMIFFLSFLGWLGCCLLTICCCGGCDTSNLLGWLCCWEICCRGGSDIDRCCDYALA